MAKSEAQSGLVLKGRVLRRTRRKVAQGAEVVRVTVLAGSSTEMVELFNPAPNEVPAIGAEVEMQVGVRVFVDKMGMAHYSLRPVMTEFDF